MKDLVKNLDLSGIKLPIEQINAAGENARALEAAKVVLQVAVREGGVELEFPYEFAHMGEDGRGGSAVAHPVVAYVVVRGLCDDIGDDAVYWAVDLRETISTLIEHHEKPGSGKISDDDSIKAISDIRDGLLELAKTLTDALP